MSGSRNNSPRWLRDVAFATIAWACAATSWAATISGTVFEDRNYGGGAGRSLATLGASATRLNGARVEIYRLAAGNYSYMAMTTTATVNGVVGSYSFTGLTAGTHRVRVVNGTVDSSRSGCSDCVPVQTFRTDASTGVVTAVTDRVGGEEPRWSDAPNRANNNANLAALTITGVQTPQSVTQVLLATNGSTVTGVDFGFNFDTIVNTRDAADCDPSGTGTSYFPCQGSLRQFIINANALGAETALTQSGSRLEDGNTLPLPAGFESSIFMIPNGSANPGQHTSYVNQLTGGVAQITLAVAPAAPLPTLTGTRTRLDASTQTINVDDSNPGRVGTGGTVGVDNTPLPMFERPEVQLNGSGSNGLITLAGSEHTILGFALRQGYISLTGLQGTARNNLVGMDANGSSALASALTYGIGFSASGSVIRNNYVTVNNSAIRSEGGGNNAIIHFNEVARPSGGHTNTFDGILLINGASNVQIVSNLVRDQEGGGIELGFGASNNSYMNITVVNNTVRNNGFDESGTTASAEPVGMVSYNYTGSNVSYYRNRVVDNAGAGLLIMAASGISASQNSFSGNGGISIDLDPVTRDPNTLGALNGVTLNDSGDTDTGPNGLLNYPVITSAVLMGGQLSIGGFARPGSSIELYRAQPDPSGFGEALAYLGTFVEGSASDLAGTTGSYGPAAINGQPQGTDTTNRFAFLIPLPAGVSSGTALTSSATVVGQTSEFGGNVIVSSGPSLTHLKTVTVLSDPFNGTTSPKSIPGSIQLYTAHVSNAGTGRVDTDSLVLTDPIPGNTSFVLSDAGAPGSGPIGFVDGAPTSELTFSFAALGSAADDVEFSNDGGISWSYVPTPDANGVDPGVTHMRVRLRGSMSANSGGTSPSFQVRWRARVK